MPYYGCSTACSRACWVAFAAAVVAGVVLMSSGAGTYATCHSRHSETPAACYRAAAAVMVAGSVIMVLAASCPLYMSSCCAQPPGMGPGEAVVQSSITVVKPGQTYSGKADVYHYDSEGRLTSAPGTATYTSKRYVLEHPASSAANGQALDQQHHTSYLHAPAFHHHTIQMS